MPGRLVSCTNGRFKASGASGRLRASITRIIFARRKTSTNSSGLPQRISTHLSTQRLALQPLACHLAFRRLDERCRGRVHAANVEIAQLVAHLSQIHVHCVSATELVTVGASCGGPAHKVMDCWPPSPSATIKIGPAPPLQHSTNTLLQQFHGGIQA